MKKLIENFIIIMVLTIAILFSYALIEKKNKWTQQFGIYKFPLQYAGKGFQ